MIPVCLYNLLLRQASIGQAFRLKNNLSLKQWPIVSTSLCSACNCFWFFSQNQTMSIILPFTLLFCFTRKTLKRMDSQSTAPPLATDWNDQSGPNCVLMSMRLIVLISVHIFILNLDVKTHPSNDSDWKSGRIWEKINKKLSFWGYWGPKLPYCCH